MPKRPCSLAITKHDSTIISADKFGDVYSLPLLFTEKAEQEVRAAETKPSAETPEPPTAFVPSANHLTVHSQRNRKALAHQKRSTNKPSEKANPTFEHKLLLGHVSMLTDVILANMKGHNYIITADRDEHIRISRGIPQSHIIEGFCLGHTEFITRICIPDTRPSLLISGGGDDDLYLWEWETGTLLSRTNLKGHVESEKIAISNILHVTTAPNNHDLILVTCEGYVPPPGALFECIDSFEALKMNNVETEIVDFTTLKTSILTFVQYSCDFYVHTYRQCRSSAHPDPQAPRKCIINDTKQRRAYSIHRHIPQARLYNGASRFRHRATSSPRNVHLPGGHSDQITRF